LNSCLSILIRFRIQFTKRGRKRRKVLPATLIIAVTISIATCSLFKKEEIKHSAAMGIVVENKTKDLKAKNVYTVAAHNLNEPHQEFTIVIDDERVWNLITEGKEYFVLVEWVDYSMTAEISGKETSLLQIEYLEK
jgi:hypothetical protein